MQYFMALEMTFIKTFLSFALNIGCGCSLEWPYVPTIYAFERE